MVLTRFLEVRTLPQPLPPGRGVTMLGMRSTTLYTPARISVAVS